MGKHRVAIILDSLAIGGAERQAFNLAIGLKKSEGFEVMVLALTVTGKGEEILKKHDVRFNVLNFEYSYRKLKILKLITSLKKEIKANDINVLIPFTYWPNVLANNARSKSIRFSVWNQRDEGRKTFGTYFEKKAIAKADQLISNSFLGKNFVADFYNQPKESILVINNGVELANVKNSRTEWRSRLNISDHTKLVVMVANLHHYKDHSTLIEAWAKVLTSSEGNFMLALAGRPQGMEEKIDSRCKELKISDSVKILGPVDDIAGLLGASDLVVHSSDNEGCPNSVLEAMVAEKPVVATRIGGTEQALGDDYKYLSVSQDPESLSQSILTLLIDKDLAIEVGLSNKKRVASDFSKSKMIDTYKNLILSH